MPIISVIMPVYNAVEFLPTTIESIINQTFNDFELILIDDGATDGSSSVCQKYASIDNRIIYVRQENQGICAARNKGIEIAKGKFIAFSDHDDEYDVHYMQKLYDLAVSTESEVIKCSVKYYNQDASGKINYENSILEDGVFLHNEIIDNYCNFSICFWGVWNALYKRELIVSSEVKFDETMHYGQEDFMFNIQLIPYIKKMAMTSECLYIHYKRLSHSTSAKFHYERLESIIEYSKTEIEILKKESTNKQWKRMFPNLLAGKIAGCLTYICLTSNNLTKIEKNKILMNFCEALPIKKCSSETGFIRGGIYNPKRIIVLIIAYIKQYKILLWAFNIISKL